MFCVYGSGGLIEKYNVSICMILNVLFVTKSSGEQIDISSVASVEKPVPFQ